eukprot:2167758-Rhodomonas_salina.1
MITISIRLRIMWRPFAPKSRPRPPPPTLTPSPPPPAPTPRTRCLSPPWKLLELASPTLHGFGFRVSGFGNRVSGFGKRVCGDQTLPKVVAPAQIAQIALKNRSCCVRCGPAVRLRP